MSEETKHVQGVPYRGAATAGDAAGAPPAPPAPSAAGWRLLLAGAACAGLAVAAGAFGAHGLRARLGPAEMAWWQTAVDYQFAHAFGLLILGTLAAVMPAAIRPTLHRAGWTMLVGIALFSGSLYALALGAPRATGMVTPAGGVAFLAGWGLLARAAWLARRR